VHFVIPSSDVLRNKLDEQKNAINQLHDQRSIIESQLNQDRLATQTQAPKISIFDTRDSLTQCMDDILYMIDQHHYLSVKLFASNTFESASTTGFSLQDYTKQLRTQLNRKKIETDIYLGDGTLIMEQLSHTSNASDILTLPAWSNAVNIFVVGQYLYFVIYHATPIAIKIQSQQLADTMHFILEQTKKTSL
jgi:hypothetical protein